MGAVSPGQSLCPSGRPPKCRSILHTPNGRYALVIDRSGKAWRGSTQILGNPSRLDGLYASTLHTVRNQTVTITGDTAEGETYAVAYHLKRPEGGKQVRIDWGIRYQDRFMRQDGAWLFAKRELIVDWVETPELPVAP